MTSASLGTTSRHEQFKLVTGHQNSSVFGILSMLVENLVDSCIVYNYHRATKIHCNQTQAAIRVTSIPGKAYNKKVAKFTPVPVPYNLQSKIGLFSPLSITYTDSAIQKRFILSVVLSKIDNIQEGRKNLKAQKHL